jgi:GH15 family glucan-1,4-alpha-glucosidase
VWETPTGAVRIVDFMPPRGANPDVVRIVEGISGRVAMSLEMTVRFDYGHVVPWVRRREGRWTAAAGPDCLWLDTPVELTGHDLRTEAAFEVAAGERVPFVLTWGPSFAEAPRPVDPHEALAQTETFWREWISHCTYRGPYEDAVRRSLLTLKALTYAPSGGIAAAATTSLPEAIGGPRNWDYRYCWLRDAAFTLQALAAAGYTAEAHAWRDWLLRAVAGAPEDLQIMYSLTGGRRITEYELDWLPGYEGSRRCGWATRPRGSSSSTCTARCWTGCTPPARPVWPPTTTLGRCRPCSPSTWRRSGASRTPRCGRCAGPASTSSLRR